MDGRSTFKWESKKKTKYTKSYKGWEIMVKHDHRHPHGMCHIDEEEEWYKSEEVWRTYWLK